jgi:transketolase
MNNESVRFLEEQAARRRIDILNLIYKAKTGHIGGSLSSIDILTALYYHIMDVDKIKAGDPERDRFVLSKGHSVEGFYSILADKGFFPKEELSTYAQFHTRLACHPTSKIPGVEISTGSLGHGLPVAVGMAIALKRDNRKSHVYVVMGDGEQGEGSVWEAAMAGPAYQLDNLTAVVDRNHLQISGNTESVMCLEPLADRYRSFGWNVVCINGNDFEEIIPALLTRVPGKPTAVISDTVKGKGISFMENQAAWHHKVPTEEQYQQAMEELLQKAYLKQKAI